MTDTPAMPAITVKCYHCNAEFQTTDELLRSGERSHCPNCPTDLRPTHTDPSCKFCSGQGVFVPDAGGPVWVCDVRTIERSRE